MEIVAVPFSLADVASRAEVRVSHAQARLTRGLDVDEDVVVHCVDGELLRARVVDLEFDLEDTHYVLEIGVRLPPPVAEVLLGGEPDDSGVYRPVSVQDVVDLIGELRRDPPEG